MTQAVELALRSVVWTGLGASGTVADQAKVKAAFDACSRGLQADPCRFDFQNVTGILWGRAIKQVDPANNKCLATIPFKVTLRPAFPWNSSSGRDPPAGGAPVGGAEGRRRMEIVAETRVIPW